MTGPEGYGVSRLRGYPENGQRQGQGEQKFHGTTGARAHTARLSRVPQTTCPNLMQIKARSLGKASPRDKPVPRGHTVHPAGQSFPGINAPGLATGCRVKTENLTAGTRRIYLPILHGRGKGEILGIANLGTPHHLGLRAGFEIFQWRRWIGRLASEHAFR